ncbi:MAG TPA: hypothetical protein VM582_07750 [Candidatus Thermoplasmatota archaeon]|nr:hypothetical protein [Candidatus Thermoplasmatota archaeon]
MRSGGVAAALVLALLLPGCAFLRAEGDEALVLRNLDIQPLTAVVRITQETGDVPIFGENVFMERGQTREYALAMRPGPHMVAVTTSTSIQEFIEVNIPERGDTTIEIEFRRGSATVKTTSTR